MLGAMTKTERLIDQIRSAMRDSGRTLKDIADASGLHRDTLGQWQDPRWRPSTNTLESIERGLKKLNGDARRKSSEG